MSIAETPAEFGSPAGQMPFVDSPFPDRVEDGVTTAGMGIQHKYEFRTTRSLVVSPGAKVATIRVWYATVSQIPGRIPGGPQPNYPTCATRQKTVTVFHGSKPCTDRSWAQFRGLKVEFHGRMPAMPAHPPRRRGKYSVADEAYDYSANDDAWDGGYDEGDFSAEDECDEDAADDDE
ncbi:hypothetical protein GGF31_002738 [Allomyces arbusculus]|nr:hypothetical protein GGF31_002738 [Allomyces arbusculus]